MYQIRVKTSEGSGYSITCSDIDEALTMAESAQNAGSCGVVCDLAGNAVMTFGNNVPEEWKA